MQQLESVNKIFIHVGEDHLSSPQHQDNLDIREPYGNAWWYNQACALRLQNSSMIFSVSVHLQYMSLWGLLKETRLCDEIQASNREQFKIE